MCAQLALFDFDGTITTSDTMLAYLRHLLGGTRTSLGLIANGPLLLGHYLRVIPKQQAKERFLLSFLGAHPREELEAAARDFADVIENLVRPEARARLSWHREQGHEIRIVSASLELWLAPWAARHGIPLIATQPRWVNGRFTGLEGRNCHGPEKVRRVEAELQLSSFQAVHAYGDSSGDREMLTIADHPYYRPFRGSGPDPTPPV